MATQTIEAIYLGVGPDLDPDDSNLAPENSGTLTGQSWGAQGSPIADQIVSLTLNDPNNDGSTSENDQGAPGETITYNGIGSILDSVVAVNVQITYNDGTTATTAMGVLQDVSGRMFLSPGVAGSPGNAVLDDAPIRSIQITGILNDSYTGINTNKETNAFVTCFAAGTHIAVPGGERLVEDIRAGDLVDTLDRGPLPVLWAARTEAVATGPASIIRIAKGALGPGQPSRGLKVSLQHRILLPGGSQLVRARALAALKGVSRIEDGRAVTFCHLLLPRHSVLFSEGLTSESFFPGEYALRMIDGPERRALAKACPDLDAYRACPARPMLRGRAERDAIAAFRADQLVPV